MYPCNMSHEPTLFWIIEEVGAQCLFPSVSFSFWLSVPIQISYKHWPQNWHIITWASERAYAAFQRHYAHPNEHKLVLSGLPCKPIVFWWTTSEAALSSFVCIFCSLSHFQSPATDVMLPLNLKLHFCKTSMQCVKVCTLWLVFTKSLHSISFELKKCLNLIGTWGKINLKTLMWFMNEIQLLNLIGTCEKINLKLWCGLWMNLNYFYFLLKSYTWLIFA
jgi:hypothetical protein